MIRFTNYSILVLAVALATSFQPVLAADIVDRVRLVRGTENGEVTDMTPLDVTLNKGRPGSKTVPLNEIRAILFDDEPAELSQARVSVTNGAFAKALQQLEKIDLPKIRRDFIKQDIEFYQALAAAKLAPRRRGRNPRCGSQAQHVRAQLPKQLPLLGSLGSHGRPAHVERPFRKRRKAIRGTRKGAMARLQNAGGRRHGSVTSGAEQAPRSDSASSTPPSPCPTTGPTPKTKSSQRLWAKQSALPKPARSTKPPA